MNTAYRGITLGVATVLCLYLLITSYQLLLLKRAQATSDSLFDALKISLLSPSTQSTKTSETDPLYAETVLRSRYAADPFSSGRKKKASHLKDIVRKKINESPFQAELWLELAGLESVAEVDVDERIFTLESALFANAWKKQQRLQVTYYCIQEPPIILEKYPKFCQKLFNNWPYKSIKANSVALGKSVNYLGRRLQQLNVESNEREN